jgi:hypothetical protein
MRFLILPLLIFAVIVGAVVLVTCKYQKTSQESKHQSTTKETCPCSVPLTITRLNQTQDAKNDTHKSTDNLPCWHILLAWPEGITAWAIIASLFVIGWQSFFTAKAAGAALLNAQAVIGAERARLAIDIELSPHLGNVEFKDSGSVAHFIVTCRNCGKTAAWIYEVLADYKIIERFPPYPAFSNHAERRFTVHYLNSGEPFSDNFSLTGVDEGGSRLLIQGVVKFRDVYDKKGKSTFGYWVREDGKTIDRIEESVAYNRNTYED